ncbi:MAG: hypothetical protein HYV09_24605 [Deltaproteobacteria bacterium]|nr:hypothetical protein [Deltaproteobacteria bacterium]
MKLVAALAVALLAVSCGGDDEDKSPASTPNNPDVLAGSTAFVAVLNPTVNEGHAGGTPASLGTARNDVPVKIGTAAAKTVDGVAVLGVPTGPIEVTVGDAKLTHTVVAEGDVYDAPIALSGANAAYFDGTPVRYAVGKASGAFFYKPTDPIATITDKLAQDDVVVVLGPGVYKGDLKITGSGVVIFGEGWAKNEVVIDGSISAEGGGVRVRGVTLTGNLASKGNNFGISFSVVRGTTSITGNGGVYLRNVFCKSATVPSSNATLLDNFGVAPLTTLPTTGVCG